MQMHVLFLKSISSNCLSTCLHVYLSIHPSCVYMFTYIHIYISICLYMYIQVYVYIYIYTSICIYKDIHTLMIRCILKHAISQKSWKHQYFPATQGTTQPDWNSSRRERGVAWRATGWYDGFRRDALSAFWQVCIIMNT